MAPWFRTTRSTRFHLLTVVSLAVLPATAFAGLILALLWAEHREQVQDTLHNVTRALATAVEFQVDGSVQALLVLASSDRLEDGRIDDFRETAIRRVAVLSKRWGSLLLVEPDGRVVFDLASPSATAGEVSSRPLIETVRRSESAAVSPLLGIDRRGEPVIEIAVPVMREQRLAFILLARLEIDPFTELLAAHTPEAGVSGLFDASHNFIARNLDSASYIGTQPIEPLLHEIQRAPSGTSRFPAYDRPDTYSAWQSIPSLGWTVSFGMPAAPIDAALWRYLLWLTGSGLGALALGVGAALWVARRITRGLSAGVAASSSLARGESVTAIDSPVTEIAALSEALVNAGRRLTAAAFERERMEAERARLVEAERDALAEAESANRRKDELIAIVAHELRTPIAAIGYAAQAMAVNGGDASKEIILRQVRNLSTLANDLLDFERAVQGKLFLRPARLDLTELARHALAAAESARRTTDCVLRLHADRPVWIFGDAARVEQLITNLISNALRHSPSGGEISVRVSASATSAVIAVSDKGEGVPPQLLPSIFEPFVQGRSADGGRTAGLGIGLALVKRIAELHGGTAYAASPGLGKGSTFSVELPLAVDSGRAAEPASAEPTE
jgi:signal transduction histidine kinase